MDASPRRPEDQRRADFAEADLELAETLDNLDGAAGYAAWIFELCAPHLHGRVLEVGAGHGTFTELIAGRVDEVVATDLSERCAAILDERFASDPKVSVVCGGLEEIGDRGLFDSVVVINVLEHIEDDRAALDTLAGLLRPGGALILWVPAFEALYSDFDRRVGHVRRYRSEELRAKVETAGLEVTESRYVNPVGGLAWLVTAKWLRRTPTDAGPVRIFDRYFVPWLRRVDRHFHPPFGQSVFLSAVSSRGGAREIDGA